MRVDALCYPLADIVLLHLERSNIPLVLTALPIHDILQGVKVVVNQILHVIVFGQTEDVTLYESLNYWRLTLRIDKHSNEPQPVRLKHILNAAWSAIWDLRRYM